MKKISQFFKNTNILFIVATIILISVIILLNKSHNDKNKNIPTTTNAKVTKGSISSTVSAGTIETANYLAVTTSVNGIVKKVYVQEGDSIVKGQKIMDITLNSDGEESRVSAYASYLSAKSNLEKAKNDLLIKESSLLEAERSFETEKVNNSYQSDDERDSYKLAENSYLISKTDYEIQKESITQAQVALNKAWLSYQAQSPTIIAQESGVIANILVVEGMDISNSLSERTSSTVASIRKEGTPIASLNISEVDINKIKVGQKTILNLNSIDNKIFFGKVAGIDKIGTTTSGVANYPVIVKFDENSDLVLPNMGVDADIVIEEKDDVLLVPTSAIETKDKGKTVILVRDGTTEITKVETGVSGDKLTEIISGINEGDTVQVRALPTEGFDTNSRNVDMRAPGMGGFMR